MDRQMGEPYLAALLAADVILWILQLLNGRNERVANERDTHTRDEGVRAATRSGRGEHRPRAARP